MTKDFQRLQKLSQRFCNKIVSPLSTTNIYLSKLQKFPIFFTKLDASFSGPGESSGTKHEEFISPRNSFTRAHELVIAPVDSISAGSRVYVELFGVRVYKGILEPLGWQPVPRWMNYPTEPNSTLDRVFVRKPDNNNLMANLIFFRDEGHTDYNKKCFCYIKTNNNTIFKAELQLYQHQHIPNEQTRVFIRLPIRNNPIYTGVFHTPRLVPIWVQ